MQISNFFSTIAAHFELAAHAVRETFSRRRSIDERRSAALTFNRIHTYRRLSLARWMCPTCNRVHSASGTNPFSGLQFPACCEFGAGPRLALKYRTGVRR